MAVRRIDCECSSAVHVRQGVETKPFSLDLFFFCVSFVLYGFDWNVDVEAHMYADDLGALISGRHVTTIVHQVLEPMKMFGIFSGLLLNMGKCGIMVKGSLSTRDKQHLETVPQGELLRGS